MFLLKGQLINILVFGGHHMVTVATIQLCLCSMKAAIDSRQGNKSSCVSTKLYLQKRPADQICQTRYKLCLLIQLGIVGGEGGWCESSIFTHRSRKSTENI